jgi:hypothetical protein
MTFQLLNNIKMTLAADLAWDTTELIVTQEDLTAAELYDPTKQLALTLVGDEELNQYEIVYATERTGTTFKVQRGKESTSPGTWSSGTTIIAALTADVLTGVTMAPTSADNVSYGGGNFGASSTVEEAIDDTGDAIVRLASDTDYYEAVQQRIGGGLFSAGTIRTDNLRWQGSAKRYVTDGAGTVLETTATIGAPSVAPDVALCLRCADITNWGSVKVRCYNAAAPTNYQEWTIASSAIPQNNAWLIAFLPASGATNGGDPTTNLPDRVRVSFQDDGTSPLTVDINFFDVIQQRLSYLGAFLRVNINSDFLRVNIVAQYGFRVSIVIDNAALPTLDVATMRRMQADGHRIYLTSTSNFKSQTQEQVLTTLYSALRTAFAAFVKPDGWVYHNGYNGPFDGDATRTVRGAVANVFPRGVGIGSFRSAVEVYRFDDPLIVAANLADATTKLTLADNTAINIDLSALSNSDLNVLMADVVTSRNFYTTTLDYQNADNLTAGTVALERLPLIPVSKGGTGGTNPLTARTNLGLDDGLGNLIGTNALITGTITSTSYQVAVGTQYIRGNAGNVHLWLQGVGGADRAVIYTDAGSAGHTYLRTVGAYVWTFGNDGTTAFPSNLYTTGRILSTGPHMILAASGGGGAVWFRPNGLDNTSGQNYVDSLGNFISSATVHSSQNFQSTSTHAVLAANGGSLYLRYAGANNAAGEWRFDGTGRMAHPNGYLDFQVPHMGCFSYNGRSFYQRLADGMFFVSNGAAKPGGGQWQNSTSDARAKEVLGDFTPGLADIKKLKPVHYRYKGNDAEPGKESVTKGMEFTGFVAQDVEKVFPKWVKKGKGWIDGKQVKDFRSLDTDELIYALLNAVKELSARVEELEAAK